MKNAIILHGTDAKSSDHWFPWLKEELEANGYDVWLPDLPQANKPNIQRYNDFLLSHGFEFNGETILFGHSSGAVAILGLIEALAEETVIDKAILVGAFRNDLGWDSLKELFLQPFDFEKIKKQAKQIVFIHSDNDPYIPLEQAEYLKEQLDAELIVLTGQGHFNQNYTTFPYLLDVIAE